MAILLYSPNDDLLAWRRELLARRPDLDVRIWPETGDPAQVTMALVWLPPPGMLAGLPNLGLILSLGAGVDAMLRDTTLPDLPLCRMIDPALTRSMSEFVLLHVLKYHRQLDLYAQQQRRGEWSFYLALPASERRVGIMGLVERPLAPPLLQGVEVELAMILQHVDVDELAHAAGKRRVDHPA